MAVDITIDAKEWYGFFDKLRRNVQYRAQRWLQAAANTIGFANIIEHFDREEGPDGRWARRKASTQLRYAMIASGRWSPPRGAQRGAYRTTNKVLHLTGTMRQSLFPGRGRTRLIGRDAVAMYAGTIYSRAHDEGYSKRGLPKREFMWLGDGTQQELVDAVMRSIAEA